MEEKRGTYHMMDTVDSISTIVSLITTTSN